MLADAVAIRVVLLTQASLAVLRGKTVIQMGTITQEESLALQAEIERVGGSYCEAPVLERTIAQGFGDSDSSTLFEVVNPTP
jgi:3-hydroxyisobutyrate dehydrogenase-like beta-hydroxyacid dehydrogenase